MTISNENISDWTWRVSFVSTVLGDVVSTGITNLSAFWEGEVFVFDEKTKQMKQQEDTCFWLEMSEDGKIVASIVDDMVDHKKYYTLVGWCSVHDIPLALR